MPESKDRQVGQAGGPQKYRRSAAEELRLDAGDCRDVLVNVAEAQDTDDAQRNELLVLQDACAVSQRQMGICTLNAKAGIPSIPAFFRYKSSGTINFCREELVMTEYYCTFCGPYRANKPSCNKCKQINGTKTETACGNPECKKGVTLMILNCGGATFGSGKLDKHGYWEHPCPECARAWEAKNPDFVAWPHESAEKGLCVTWISDGLFTHGYWCIGQERPLFPNAFLHSITAEGDELEYIRDHFKNIPICNHLHSVRWDGDFAKFIFHNF